MDLRHHRRALAHRRRDSLGRSGAHIADRDEKAVCPRCGSREVETVFGSFAVGGAGKSGSGGDLLSRGFSGAALGAPKP